MWKRSLAVAEVLHTTDGTAPVPYSASATANENAAVVKVNRVGQTTQAGAAIVVTHLQDAIGIGRRLVDHGGFGDNQSGATPGAGLVIGDHGIARRLVFGEKCAVAGGENAVADFDATNAQRRKQIGERPGHDLSARLRRPRVGSALRSPGCRASLPRASPSTGNEASPTAHRARRWTAPGRRP